MAHMDVVILVVIVVLILVVGLAFWLVGRRR
jgi:predicted permease